MSCALLRNNDTLSAVRASNETAGESPLNNSTDINGSLSKSKAKTDSHSNASSYLDKVRQQQGTHPTVYINRRAGNAGQLLSSRNKQPGKCTRNDVSQPPSEALQDSSEDLPVNPGNLEFAYCFQ